MLRLFGIRAVLLLACGLPAGLLLRTKAIETQPAEGAAPEAIKDSGTKQLSPGPIDGSIAFVAARLLERHHYRQHPFDDQISDKFLDRYLDAFDPRHDHFTEADLAEFEPYRDKLDDLTLSRRDKADTTPAYKIFARFVERLQQRVAYAEELLKNEKFEFNTDERIRIDRRDAPYPRDLDEARELWRQRLRYEYLQEKLGRTGTKKSDAAAVKQEAPAEDPAQAPEPAKQVEKKSDAEEIADLLTRRYRRSLHLFKEWDHDDVMQAYLTALANVYDPHSDYFNKSQADNFAIGMNLQLFGIGAELFSDEGYCTIRRLTPNGPAEKSNKLKAKDRIVAVAQSNGPPVDVVDMSLNKVVQMIRGPKGAEVRLTIIPAENPSERRVLALIRDEIKLEENEAKAKVIEFSADDGKTLRLGVVDLPSFYATMDLGGPKPIDLAGDGTPPRTRSTSADVARLLGKLKREDIDGVILDLRRNGGGSLEEAIKLTGLFIKEGPVVMARAPDGTVTVHEDEDSRVLYDGPLIILTSRFSASASEILAGALQDYGRAVIVGDLSTHGKGTVQNLNPLRAFIKSASASSTDDPGQLKTTIRMFFRPGGSSTQLKGVMPDIVLPSVWNYVKDIGEKALENPLAWDAIPAAKYDKLDLVEAYLPELMRRSGERVANNQDFAYIREDIELYRKTQADRTVSLNEQERLKEKEEIEARRKAREKERLARKERDQKIYELALRQVDLPGLTLVEKTNHATRTLAGQSATSTASTNSASVAAKPASKTIAEDEEEAAPAVDATLEEAEKILVDYIRLLSQKGLASSSR
jgi:carboxyl-terminal processing protease